MVLWKMLILFNEHAGSDYEGCGGDVILLDETNANKVQIWFYWEYNYFYG